ncbi:hypothetical protein [Candidatus Flexifilum breve]
MRGARKRSVRIDISVLFVPAALSQMRRWKPSTRVKRPDRAGSRGRSTMW